jgi:hypothetical protein
VATSIRAVARQLAGGGLPGDGVLAVALENTADQSAGPDRQAAAQRDLELGQVLLDGGGISSGQYQSVVAVLMQTGATEPTTTTTAPPPTTTVPPSVQPQSPPPGHDHHHHHGEGNGQG